MKRILCFATLFLLYQFNYAQINSITTAVPFLLNNPNAQSMGIADIGVVAATGYYESGLTQNPALLSRNEKVMGAKFSYKPSALNFISGFNTIDASLYYAINKKITLAYSYNRYTWPRLTLTDANAQKIAEVKPVEDYHNLRYAQSLGPNLSLGIGLKYIVSNLTDNNRFKGKRTYPGKALAGDIGLDYRKEFAKKETSFWRYDIGASIVNMGNKVKYMDTIGFGGDFLPMQLAIGTMWTYTKDINKSVRYSIDLAYQAEKLLVPTPPFYYVDQYGNRTVMEGKDPNVSVVKGAFQSFNDAPDGGQEELKEIIHKVGMENRFTFKNKWGIALRTGLFNENKLKGNRKYVNAGIGIRYAFLYLDFSTILRYKTGEDIHGKPIYASGLKDPNSYCITLGFKYTFKDKATSNGNG